MTSFALFLMAFAAFWLASISPWLSGLALLIAIPLFHYSAEKGSK